MGAAGQPMPEQPAPASMPEQPIPEQPLPTQPEPIAPTMTVEEQMVAAMAETTPNQPSTTIAPTKAPKKKSSIGAIGMIFFAILAIGGIVFGVMMMLDKDSLVASYDNQIKTLTETKNTLQNQLDSMELLNGDEALSMLKQAVTEQKLPYNILSANVYAKYTGDEDAIAYWVQYISSQTDAPSVMTMNNIIFSLDEDTDEWSFALPGFTAEDPNYSTIVSEYTVL